MALPLKFLPQQTDNSLTYLNLADAMTAGVPIARMKNKAGNIVSASTSSVSAAMDAITDSFKAGKAERSAGNFFVPVC